MRKYLHFIIYTKLIQISYELNVYLLPNSRNQHRRMLLIWTESNFHFCYKNFPFECSNAVLSPGYVWIIAASESAPKQLYPIARKDKHQYNE